MKTDVKDTEHGYEITMNLPGVKKEDVKAALKDGYLTISATSDSKKEEKNDKGQYIRRERYSGSCSRSFYVGDAVTEEDIKAKFENGTLKMLVPKKKSRRLWKIRNTLPLKDWWSERSNICWRNYGVLQFRRCLWDVLYYWGFAAGMQP